MTKCDKCGFQSEKEFDICPQCGKNNDDQLKEKTFFKTQIDDEGSYLVHSDDQFSTIKKEAGDYGDDPFENLTTGYRIDERYEIIQNLGSGAFGSVFKVYDHGSKSEKAVKVIFPDIEGIDQLMNNLRKEIKIMSIFQDVTHIVRSFDLHYQGDIKFIDMEYLAGGSLRGILKKLPEGILSEAIALKIARQIAEGMIEIHNRNIIHKDLKPENILLSESYEKIDAGEDFVVKITDFGISEKVSDPKSHLEFTSTSGTRIYQSPEHLIGQHVGIETDIWSFGIILYEMLIGSVCFPGANIDEVLESIKQILKIEKDNESEIYQQYGEITPVSGISTRTMRLINKCLHYNYKDRFQNFNEVIEHLKGTKSYTLFKPKDISDLVLVEAGTMLIGNRNGLRWEEPEHFIKLNDFYIAKYPVTHKEWKIVIGNITSHYSNELLPVDNVSWYDAIQYCNEKSRRDNLDNCYKIDKIAYDSNNENKFDDIKNIVICDYKANGYRLPTEAEWEYAAKGGKLSESFIYSGSNNPDEVAWYKLNSESMLHLIGQKKPNELGLYDMSGNVWEWCWDWFDEDYYDESDPNIYFGPDKGKFRVIRGGAWDFGFDGCRSSYRGYFYPHYKNSTISFRIVRNIVQQ